MLELSICSKKIESLIVLYRSIAHDINGMRGSRNFHLWGPDPAEKVLTYFFPFFLKLPTYFTKGRICFSSGGRGHKRNWPLPLHPPPHLAPWWTCF